MKNACSWAFSLVFSILSILPNTASANNVAVSPQNYTKYTHSCDMLNPVTVGEWDLNGDGKNELVRIEHTALGAWANHFVVFDFQSGCYYYPLESSLSGDPRSQYVFSAVQMDSTPGLELVVRPRPSTSGGGSPTWSGATRVVNQTAKVWYLIDYGAQRYESYQATDNNGLAGADLSALGRHISSNGDISYYWHVFSMLPSPAFRQYQYDATVHVGTPLTVVAPYNGAMVGQLDNQPGEEGATVHLAFGSVTDGYVRIFSDRDRTTWNGLFAGSFGTRRAVVRSASIEGGRLKVVVDYVNTVTGSTSQTTFQYGVNYNTTKSPW